MAKDRFAVVNQSLQSWTPKQDYVSESQSWFTGQNRGGTRNGWNNAFVDQYVSSWDRSLNNGTARSFFDTSKNENVTGVATWDHTTDSGEEVRFGDIFENGKKVGNVYDDHDTDEANLMMAPWLLTKDQQARAYEKAVDGLDSKKGRPDLSELDQQITELRERNRVEMPKALQAAEMQAKVKETQDDIQGGFGDEALGLFGGGAGGAVVGAGAGGVIGGLLGSLAGGVGAVPGAAAGAKVGSVLGGLIGGTGGLLNKDEISESAARGFEQAKLSWDENNPVAAFGTSVSKFGELGGKLIQPTSNLAKGITDAAVGDVGDGVSERYRIDKKGESTAPTWAKALDIGATVTDGLAQFISPAGRIAYLGTMAAQVGGEATEYGATLGASYDPRAGAYDNTWLDDDGGFDPVSGLAGLGKIGIDAVQMIGWGGLAQSMGRRGAAAAAGREQVEMSGHRFILDEAGEVTGKKWTLSLLAPSEQLAWASTKHSARVAAMKEGRAVTPDDLYRAASNLANGSNKLKTAMVNTFGEAYEEGVQAILEPVSHDGRLSGSEIGNAMLYGGAGGLGMSLGATAAAPSRDARLMAQAYAIESVRRGEEIDFETFKAEWGQFDDQQKRVLASRSKADAVVGAAAVKQMAEDRVATMIGTELDAARAEDAKRTAIAKEIRAQNPKTDMFTVMGGQLSAGEVSKYGTALGDTAHAEAVDMSALTVHKVLDQRLTGLGLQAQEVLNQADRIEAENATDERLPKLRAEAAHLELSRQVGGLILEDVRRLVEQIYTDGVTVPEAQTLNRQLNGILQGIYEEKVPVAALDEDTTSTEEQRREAGAYFVSLLQAREPKLDAGSWVITLPRSSWELTETRTDDFIQVNTDILQAINGDFDGDKLRAENQLVLSRERYRQIRSGQTLGGNTEGIDIGVRNFDEGFTRALAAGLKSGNGQLKAAAESTVDAIDTALRHRYGPLMSPEAFDRVMKTFRTSVVAGSDSARVGLLNGLAKEAGQAITELGKAQLRNEWLWASKVVRANLQSYQRTYRNEMFSTSTGPSPTEDVADLDTPEGKNVRKKRATTDAQTLSLWAVGNTLFRKFQKIHYTWYNAPTVGATRAEKNDLEVPGSFYEELARNVTQAEIDLMDADDSIVGRAMVMLSRIVEDAMKDPLLEGKFSPGAAMTLVANMRTKDVWRTTDGTWVTDGADMSIAQVVLKRALDQDREERSRSFDRDDRAQARHARLRALVVPNSVRGEPNAQQAFIEIFRSVPFQDSLAGLTGHLAPQTSPEQWLRNFRTLDQVGREREVQLLKQVPEYLDREERTDPPYTLKEYERQEITPYLAMVDAMVATGRAELTFDPDKLGGAKPEEAFGGRQARVAQDAAENIVAGHTLVREAMENFRKTLNRRDAKRMSGAEVAQEMFRVNPQRGRDIMAGMFPDAMANAIYTTDAATGRTEVATWVYGLFEIEDSNVALYTYWAKTMMQGYFSKIETLMESDPTRAYDSLNSRFQRLLFRLAQEPGQLHLEQVLRQMNSSKNLWEFFGWLNHESGIRQPGFEAVYLPFNDDVADFEADVSGGWTTVRAGSDLREGLAAMSRAAKELATTMSFRETKHAADKIYYDSIVRAYTDDPTADDTDRDNLRKLTLALKNSQELPRGFAPSAMLALTRGAMDAFAEQSHDKGRTPAPFEAHGEFQAIMDAFGFVPGTERIMGAVDAYSINDLRINIGDLARSYGTAMTSSGAQVEWQPLDLGAAIEMLGDSRTAPLAHALLTPSAVDVTPSGTTERLLMEASLSDLLDDRYYKDLYSDHPPNGKLDQAMRGLSIIESRARHEGGNFPVLRYVNALAVAWTSKLGRPATPADQDRLVQEAYLYTWDLVKMVGRVQATKGLRDADMLRLLREYALKTLNERRKAHVMPGFVDKATGEVDEQWIELMLTQLKDEHDELQEELLESDLPSTTQQARSDKLKQQYQENEARIEGLLDDSMARTSLERFRLVGDTTRGTANVDRDTREHIATYVLSMANFGSRAPEAALAWSRLSDMVEAGVDYLDELEVDDWDALSRGAMGVNLFDQVVPTSSHISIPPFPKGDPAISDDRFFKYFDPSYSWVVTDILDEGSPLTAAASWLYFVAEQPRELLSMDQLKRTLNTTVLRENAFGPLTPGLKAQLKENEQRMDSDSAPPGIAAAGNGQKRQGGLAGGTRRDGRVPDAAQLTPATFTADKLAGEDWPFEEIQVQPAGASEAITMPLGQMENRFFASIKVDGNVLPLDEGNLGYRWDGAERDNPYRYVSMTRLLPILERYADWNNMDLADMTLEVEFFHPDSQPADWDHNSFFEGMSHSVLPDDSESLISTLWSDNAGKIAEDTQWTIDSGKKGLRAIQPFRRPTQAQMDRAKNLWEVDHDFAAMLRAKTELVMLYDDGSGPLSPSYYNAQYKHRKLTHIVVGRDPDGNPAAMKAEEVIAFQRTNGKFDANGDKIPLPLEDAKLVVLSQDVLRTMVGDTGDQSLGEYLDESFRINATEMQRYRGIDSAILERFGEGWLAPTISIGQTTLVNVGHQKVQTVRTMRTTADRNARQERILYLNKQASEAWSARQKKLPPEAARKGLSQVLDVAKEMVGGDKRTFSLSHLTGGLMLPRDIHKAKHTQVLLEGAAAIVSLNEHSRGFTVVDGGITDYPGGVIAFESLSEDRPAEDRLVRSDLALVSLESFLQNHDVDKAEERVETALEHISHSGATIVLGPGPAASELRYHAAKTLEALGYVPVAGSHYIFEPAEFSFRTQSERAHESTLVETSTVKPNRNAVTLLSVDPVFEIDENDAILNPDSTKLRDRKLVRNLVPSAWRSKFNIPLEDNRTSGLYARTLAHLRETMRPDNLDARSTLLKMAGPDPKGLMPITDALDRFYDRLTRTGTMVPQVGDAVEVGDIIPFVDSRGNVVLYRHGFKLPRYDELNGQFEERGLKLALARSESEGAQTKNSGKIRRFEPRVGYGYEMVLEVPLQQYGDKVQLEWNGMKYVVVPPPTGFRLPKIFKNGMPIDLLSDLASALSKEAHAGRVNNYRNALAFFQFDFTDDITAFFFPDQKDRTPEARITAVNLLHRLASADEFKIPLDKARELSLANVAVADLLGDFAEAQSSQLGVDPQWLDTILDTQTASNQIGRALVMYAMTPGADIDSVIMSSGFSHPRANTDAVETRLVPGIFADLLDHGFDSAVHQELIRRFDGQLLRGPKGEGLRLKSNWQVEVHTGTKTPPFMAYLQFGEAHSSGDNPELDGQAYDETDRSDVSIHNALAAGLSIGATTVHQELKKSKAFARSMTLEGKRFTTQNQVWDALTTLPNIEDASNAGYRQETPRATVRRAMAHEETVGYYKGLDDSRWDKAEGHAVEYNRFATKVLDALNLYGSQRVMVDTWVRQMLGRPYAVMPDGTERGVINGRDAVETVRLILENVQAGDLPTKFGRQPLMDVNHLTTIYMKNVNRDGQTHWAPRMGVEATSPRATSWDDWVATALGTAFDEKANRRFDSIYLLAADGFMHGYQGATSATRDLPVSSDSLVNEQLYDEQANLMLVSISEDENLLANDPTLWNSTRASLEDMLGAQRLYAPGRHGPDASSAEGVQDARIRWWRQETKTPEPSRKDIRGVRASGNAFISFSTKTNRAYRMAFNLRVGNTMFNVALIAAAPIEAFYRRTIDSFAKAATMEGSGLMGRAQTRLMESISDTSIGAVAEMLGVQPTYTSKQLVEMNQMIDKLASLPAFKAMIYKELMYQYPSMPGIGKMEKWLETYAKFGAKIQDPAWGLLPRDLARIYVDTAMRHIIQNWTGENIYSVDRLLKELPRNPEWLKEQDHDSHSEAIASLANIRSTKPTLLSLAVRGWVDPLSENTKFLPNTAGNFFKILLAFQNFWANFGTNMTGLQGVEQFATFWFDGRKKSKLVRRMQASLRGVEFDPNHEEVYDMSEAIESMDLADAFIRGGITHTALFTFGVMAGGLGLDGEDDEQKFRRRQAELQGVPVLYDPRDIANDFRNKDSIFLNNLPFGLDSLFTDGEGKLAGMHQMSWIARTFISPVLGMQRFFDTGDPMEIVHGFKDAMGAHPVMNEQLWDTTMETVADLHDSANAAAEKGDGVQAMGLLTSIVTVMERMLFENGMFNVIYQGLDDYDRDPYVLPLTNSEGEIQRDFEGNARPQNLALATFYEDGKLKEGYANRRESNVLLHQLSENRFTLALIGSLLDGGLGQSDFWRYNMPIKTRTIEKEQYSQAEAEAFVKAAYMAEAGGLRSLTEEELMPKARDFVFAQARATGEFNANWESDARALAREWSRQEGRLKTSLMKSSGGEELTDAGARGIFEGLRSGTLQFGDLDKSRGVSISYEMRERIARDWTKELVQEGIDLGLDKSTAIKRMKRITQGPLDDPTRDGLADLLFDTKNIPLDTKVKYAQLNTTYVMGPDGRPWATGFERDGLAGAFGLKMFKDVLQPEDGVTRLDIRANTVDLANGMNTGLRALEPMHATRNIPTAVEIGKSIEKAIEDAAKADYEKFEPFKKFDSGGGSGWRDFGGSGWRNFGSGWSNFGRRRGGGGGGGYSGGGGYFVRMNPLPDNISTYGNQLQFINTSNPILRRAFVRRERVQSERGRLKQWQ